MANCSMNECGKSIINTLSVISGKLDYTCYIISKWRAPIWTDKKECTVYYPQNANLTA
jgi:hypothetical protein